MSLVAEITGMCPYAKALFDKYILATRQTELGRNSQHACVIMVFWGLDKLNYEVLMVSPPPLWPLSMLYIGRVKKKHYVFPGVLM